jgi:hypothetical protein
VTTDDVWSRTRDVTGVVICACGCGTPTPVASQTHRSMGLMKGQPTRYLRGHSGRIYSPLNLDNWTEEDRGYETPCRIWLGGHTRAGYGLISLRFGGRVKTRQAHIVVWESENGPVPDGLELDHKCEVHPCVRRSHLEPVTHAENLRRSPMVRGPDGRYLAKGVRLK